MKSLDSWSDLPPIPPPPSFPYGSNWCNKIADLVFLPYISIILAFRALESLRGIGKPYVKSLDSRSDLPPDTPPPPPPHGSNWDHKIADIVFLPYISFC